MSLVTCRIPGTTGFPPFEAILAPVALTCFGQLPHELYMATEHLPTAVGKPLLQWGSPLERLGKLYRFFDDMLASQTSPECKMLAREVDPTGYAFSAVFATRSQPNGMAYIGEGTPLLRYS
jgi:hypothetical protein